MTELLNNPIAAVFVKNGIFALTAAVIAWAMWRQTNRISAEATAREERLHAEAKADRDRMHADSLAREERLMTHTEQLAAALNELAHQYDGLATDVHEIRTAVFER